MIKGVVVAVVVLVGVLALLTFVENRYYPAGEDVNLAPRLSSRNFCLDRDGADIGTANTALEINMPNGVLALNGAGGFVFAPGISGVVAGNGPDTPPESFDFTLTGGNGAILRVTPLNDRATSATRQVKVDDSPEPGQPSGQIIPGSWLEWVSSNSNAGGYAGGPGMTGPVSSPGAPGVTSADDQSYESPCRNPTGAHQNLAGSAPTSITITFAGSNGNLPVSGSASGISVSNNQVTFNSNAGYVRKGTSP